MPVSPSVGSSVNNTPTLAPMGPGSGLRR
jgi:hypothetical protein